jgi:hypothetical protein
MIQIRSHKQPENVQNRPVGDKYNVASERVRDLKTGLDVVVEHNVEHYIYYIAT